MKEHSLLLALETNVPALIESVMLPKRKNGAALEHAGHAVWDARETRLEKDLAD